MSGLFCYCTKLISLPDISKWETQNVTNMSYMFSNCLKLKSLPDISIWTFKENLQKAFMFEKLNKNVIPKKLGVV